MSQYINMPVAKAAAQQEKTSKSHRDFLAGLRLFCAVAAVFVLVHGLGATQPRDAGVGQAGQSHGHLVFREYVPQP